MLSVVYLASQKASSYLLSVYLFICCICDFTASPLAYQRLFNIGVQAQIRIVL